MFPVHGKNDLKWPQTGPGGFFPTNPDLANILGRTDLDFENLHFLDFLTPNFWISGPQIYTFLDFQVPRSPNSQISNAQVSQRLMMCIV